MHTVRASILFTANQWGRIYQTFVRHVMQRPQTITAVMDLGWEIAIPMPEEMLRGWWMRKNCCYSSLD